MLLHELRTIVDHVCIIVRTMRGYVWDSSFRVQYFVFYVVLFGVNKTLNQYVKMKKSSYIICVFLFSFGWNCLFVLQCSELAAQQPLAKVEKIIDGDTIQVRYKSNSIKVRLWGIDTPEYYQAFSKVAKKFTSRLVRNTSVSLDLKDWDKYGRMVAIVTLRDGRLLNEELLKSGLAWVHVYYCKEAICNKWYGYEKRAREKRIGLWRDSSPVPPWVWKHRKRK